MFQQLKMCKYNISVRYHEAFKTIFYIKTIYRIALKSQASLFFFHKQQVLEAIS